jgi:hypothetical protein
MKNLILINGTMGVGKTVTSIELQKLLPQNVFLDGDWCWNMVPFVVNEETKKMVMDNIIYLLNNFIRCSEYENIIFCWVMHEQAIIDEIVSKLEINNCKLHVFSLVCSETALIKRIEIDIGQGKRTEDVINRTLPRLKKYYNIQSTKIDVSDISAMNAAEKMKQIIEDETRGLQNY